MKKSRISIEKENDKTKLIINPLSFLKRYKTYMFWANKLNFFLIIIALAFFFYFGTDWELIAGEYKYLGMDYRVALICIAPIFIIWLIGLSRVIADKKGYGQRMLMVINDETASIKHKTHTGNHKLSSLTVKTLKEKRKDNSDITLEIVKDKNVIFTNTKLPKEDTVKLKEFAKTYNINYKEGIAYVMTFTARQRGK